MGLTFLVGLILLIIGKLKRDKNNNLIKSGLIFAGIPTSIAVLLLLMNLFSEIFSSKPNEKDLVGKYHIVEVTNLDFDKNTYDNYNLQFYKNGQFTLTPTPYIDVCENGKYDVDYSSSYNELSLQCENDFTSAHINRGFGNHQIEFVIGDPDSGESIFFEKVENK